MRVQLSLLGCAALAAASLVFSAASAEEPPRKSPEFVIQQPNGHQLLLSQFRGKVVALEFLFTTCPHCAHTSQVMSKLYSEWGRRGLQPLGVAWNDPTLLDLITFIHENGVNYPIGISTRDTVCDYLGIEATTRLVVPQIVLIDRRGMIRFHTVADGDDLTLLAEPSLREKIDLLLKEPAHHRATVPSARKKKS